MPWVNKHQKRIPIERCRSQLSAVTDAPPACHCGKSAHRIVHDKSGKGFIGFCADHLQEAEDAARKRYKISEQRRTANWRSQAAWARGGKLSDLSDHNHNDNGNRHVKKGRRK